MAGYLIKPPLSAFFFLVLIALYIAVGVCHADVTSSRIAGLSYLITQQKGDGNWSPAKGMEVPATAESLTALFNSGMHGQGTYARGVSWLANAKTSSVDALTRKIMVLQQAGLDTTLYTTSLLDIRYNASDVYGVYGYFWGTYPGYGSSFPDTMFGLAALRKTLGYPDPSQLTVALDCQVLPSQHTDGGWVYASLQTNTLVPDASPSIVMPTAFTLLELKEIQLATNWISIARCGQTYNLTTAINNGLNYVFSKRLADGGYGDDTVSTPLETALAYRVIKKLAPADSRGTDALNWLLSHQNADGSWPGGVFVTAAVLASFDPVVLTDTDKDGVPDAVELNLGTNPNLSDTRYAANGNQVTSTLVVPIELGYEIILGVPFTYNLSAYGGKAPYSWSMTTGILPPGLALNTSTGLISGTPNQVGSFSFSYKVTDSTPTPGSQTISGYLSVLLPPIAMADGDLNGDGVVNVADVLLAERIALGLDVPTASQLLHSDVAPAGIPNGVIDGADVMRIRRKALGLEVF